MWKRLHCGRRRSLVQDDRSPVTSPSGATGKSSTVVVVNCRGTRFETSQATLLRLGPCYLATMMAIDTPEEVFLDYSPAAFKVVLDGLTLAHTDIKQSLSHILSNRAAVVDLPALLEFALLGWVLGVRLPLPTLPPGMPTDEPIEEHLDDDPLGFKLGTAYHGDSGVFRHMMEVAPRGSYQELGGEWFHGPHLPLPGCYSKYADVPHGLLGGGDCVEPVERPSRGCIPVSVEISSWKLDCNTDSAEHDEWWETNEPMAFSSVCMLKLHRSGKGALRIHLVAGSEAVFDLGPRRILRCEGLVLGIARQAQDIERELRNVITVDALSDLDRGESRKIQCQALPKLSDHSVTFVRLPVPPEAQGFGRMFRLTLDVLWPSRDEYLTQVPLRHVLEDDVWGSHYRGPVPSYQLYVVEFFGDLLDLPPALVPEGDVLDPFVFDTGAFRVKRRKRA